MVLSGQRNFLRAGEGFLTRRQSNAGIAVYMLLYCQGLCGANTTTDRRDTGEIALQLPSLVLCWFM